MSFLLLGESVVWDFDEAWHLDLFLRYKLKKVLRNVKL
jgi:hypothetical protein